MTGERARKCCPRCNSLGIHRSKRVYTYICSQCGEHLKSCGPLRRCSHCKSTSILRNHTSNYACCKCGCNFDVPSLRNVKSPIGNLPRSLLPKKEVQV